MLNAVRRARELPDSGSARRKDFVRRLNASEKPLIQMAACFGDVTAETKQYALSHDVELYDFDRIKDRYEYLSTPGHVVEPESIGLRVNPGGISKARCLGLTADEIATAEATDQPRHPPLDPLPDFEMWTFLSDVKGVFEAVKQHQDGVFQSNLRYRLIGRAEGRIGRQIQDTILKSGPLLLPLNNGITVVCRDIREAGEAVVLVRPQIVNGGQTAWAIHDACKELQTLFPQFYAALDLSVLTKVIKTSDSAFVQRVTEATNNQNPIFPRDQRADRPEQISIQRAFDAATFGGRPTPVLYEQKRGQFESLLRMRAQGRYRIRGSLYRRIDNELAGQLYLALLGLPHASKNRKREIFENESIYRTIFGVESSPAVRFSNDDLGLDPRFVKLRSGSDAIFRDDVIFGFGLFRLASVHAKLHRMRIASWPLEETDSNNYRVLTEHRFLQVWPYHVVHAMNYIVESMTRGNDEERSRLRTLLVGANLDRLFDRGLGDAFVLANGTQSYVVLDEERASAEFPVFGTWITSLTAQMYDIVRSARERPEWKSERHFFDLRSETVGEMTARLDQILGGPRAVRERWFPLLGAPAA